MLKPKRLCALNTISVNSAACLSLQAVVACTRAPLQVHPLPACLGFLPRESKMKVSSSQCSTMLQLQGALWIHPKSIAFYLISHTDTAQFSLRDMRYKGKTDLGFLEGKTNFVHLNETVVYKLTREQTAA